MKVTAHANTILKGMAVALGLLMLLLLTVHAAGMEPQIPTMTQDQPSLFSKETPELEGALPQLMERSEEDVLLYKKELLESPIHESTPETEQPIISREDKSTPPEETLPEGVDDDLSSPESLSPEEEDEFLDFDAPPTMEETSTEVLPSVDAFF